jgi:hypothetical protein
MMLSGRAIDNYNRMVCAAAEAVGETGRIVTSSSSASAIPTVGEASARSSR